MASLLPTDVIVGERVNDLGPRTMAAKGRSATQLAQI
jgi:hypothetical protein